MLFVSEVKGAIDTGKKKTKNSVGGSLADYMTLLLNMPANEEEKEQFAANGYKGKEINQALLLARSVLEKAISSRRCLRIRF